MAETDIVRTVRRFGAHGFFVFINKSAGLDACDKVRITKISNEEYERVVREQKGPPKQYRSEYRKVLIPDTNFEATNEEQLNDEKEQRNNIKNESVPDLRPSIVEISQNEQ